MTASEGPNNDEDHTSTNPLTESSRLTVFSNIDQNAWARVSIDAQKKLEDLFRTNTFKFKELLLEAGKLRHDAQDALTNSSQDFFSHGNQFGILRGDQSHGEDRYDNNQFASADNIESKKLFQDIKNVLASKVPHKKQNKKYPSVWVKNETSSKFPRVIVIWGDMNETIFTKFCAEIDKTIIKPLQNPACQNEDALELIASLFYHLARAIPFERGSAACTQWLVRAIASTKGYLLTNMRIDGLAADIYAQIESDEKVFVKKFVGTYKHTKTHNDKKDTSISESTTPPQTAITTSTEIAQDQKTTLQSKVHFGTNQYIDHRKYGPKKEMLDEILKKIHNLQERGGQESRIFFLSEIYKAFLDLNLSNTNSINTCQNIITKNIRNLEGFDWSLHNPLGKVGAWIATFFKKDYKYAETMSDTKILVLKLNDWIEKNAYPEERRRDIKRGRQN